MTGSLGDRRNRRTFNPFNLKTETSDRDHKIQFERLPKSVRTRPLWWLILVFILSLWAFYYLKSQF